MSRLRGEGGCPWDREQTFQTIKPYLLQETYEVLDAIDREDWHELSHELGDLLLQVVFFAQMAQEAGHFDVGDALGAINDKLIRRHPHIFGSETALTGDDVKKRWDEIKNKEKNRPTALLDSVPRALPALVEAEQISARAAGKGFDWKRSEDVLNKLHEELQELAEAQSNQEREGELGDLLFTVVNLARHMKIDPEQALRRTNAKFRQRFAHVETQVAGNWQTTPLEEMERFWQQAKQ